MSFDGVFLHGISHELSTCLVGGRIDKVHQPDKTTIVIAVRSGGKNHQLYLSSHPSFCRVHLTQEKQDNPSHPPLFCMVMRKHLVGGKIIAIHQPGLERLIQIQISAYNELGDLENKTLVCEIMGKHSNIILLDEQENKVIDSIKRISHSVNRYRQLLPGHPYLAPPVQDKWELTSLSQEQVEEMVMTANDQAKLAKLLVTSYQGISPLLASELIFRCGFAADLTANSCGLFEIQTLTKHLAELQEMLLMHQYSPTIARDKQNRPVAFSALTLSHLANVSLKPMDSLNEAADSFFSTKQLANTFSQQQIGISQKLSLDINKLTEKIFAQEQELATAEAAQEDRIKGQLLTANLYQIKQGQSSTVVLNYFEPDSPQLEIALDSTLSPNENAQYYFKRYNKSKKAIESLTVQLALGNDELEYLESIYNAIEQAGSLQDLEEIKLELIQQGYLAAPKVAKNKKKKEADQRPAPLEYSSSEGFKILVGKNNKQNDWLTLRHGQDTDIWLHAKKIPGAHVIIKTDNRSVGDVTLHQAALLAAYYSKSRHSNQVPIDYTFVKHVKKPSGAKPGMVIYTNEQTIYTSGADPWLESLGLID